MEQSPASEEFRARSERAYLPRVGWSNPDEDRALAPPQQWIDARIGIRSPKWFGTSHNREAREAACRSHAIWQFARTGETGF